MTRGSAVVTLRESPAYGAEHFRAGLRSLGYSVSNTWHDARSERDVLVVWNRRPVEESMIRAAEARGARVLVIENGYLGADANGEKLFAMAFGHHSGAGSWPEPEHDRWSPLGLRLEPWRTDGEDVVVLGQRCIGEHGVAQPEGWPEMVAREIAARTRRRVRIRPHPGVARTDPRDELRGAWCAVTWSSGAGLKSLLYGIPVFHGLPAWIGGAAASPYSADEIEHPATPDRLPMLWRLAWAQWTRAEIAAGEAFARYGL